MGTKGLTKVGSARRLAGSLCNHCSSRRGTLRRIIAVTAIPLLVGLRIQADDRAFEQRFSEEYARMGIGWVSDASLVDTNNPRPMLGDKPLPFSRFRAAGELGGIRLGMTMSQVVAVWGKPRTLFTHCGNGPRFTYGHTVCLFFQEDCLVRISLDERLLERLVFDNGFKAGMRRPQAEALLGSSAPGQAEQGDAWSDDTKYVSGGVCMTVSFHDVPRTPTSAWQVQAVDGVAVGLDKELSRKVGGQGASQKATPPHR
jgi:hypothetical protein